MGKAVKSVAKVALAPATGGLSLLGGGGSLKDTLFGKKDQGTGDRIIGLDPSLSKVVESARPQQAKASKLIGGELDAMKGTDSKKMAQLALSRGTKSLLGQGKDAERRAKQLIAQRGLGRSSVGLNAMVNAGNTARDKVSDLRANMPAIQQKMARERMGTINSATAGLGNILNAQGARRGFIAGRQATGKRGGGLANVAMTIGGAVAGGMSGGPKGAGAGMQMGSGMGSMLSGMA